MEQTFIEEFSDVFDQNEELGCMEGPPMVITLKKDAVPYYVNGARPIPFADRPQVKKKLDELVDKKITIPVTDPSDWAAPLVVMRKPDSSIRVCGPYQTQPSCPKTYLSDTHTSRRSGRD